MSLNLSETLSGVDWASCTGYTVSDPRLLMKINEALRRCLIKGKYVGSTQGFQICIHSSCLTWPRPIDTIEAAWLCTRPLSIRNEWFEALPMSYGRQTPQQSCAGDLLDRGRGFVQFDDLIVPSQIQIYATYSSDLGKQILVQGRDMNNQWIYSQQGGVNGVYVTLATPYATVVDDNGLPILFKQPGLIGVQKPVTKGPVRAYAYDPTGGEPLLALSYWEPDETLPDYRRSMVPGLSTNQFGNCCFGATGDPPTQSGTSAVLTVIAKKRFIPVAQPTDLLILENLPAIKEMTISVIKAERGLITESMAHEARAVQLLEDELASYQGTGTVQPIKVDEMAYAAGENYMEGGWNLWQ